MSPQSLAHTYPLTHFKVDWLLLFPKQDPFRVAMYPSNTYQYTYDNHTRNTDLKFNMRRHQDPSAELP